jgi:hypothetical protein
MKDDNVTTDVTWSIPIFAWWGLPQASGDGGIDGQLKRFQAFTTDLQKAYGDAYSS